MAGNLGADNNDTDTALGILNNGVNDAIYMSQSRNGVSEFAA
jgi:hypothetical protein